MRFVIGVVLAVSVGIGAYLGSARAAGSATAPARTVQLRIGDIAVVGQLQCRAWTDSRSNPIPTYLECSKGPWNPDAVSVTVFPGGVTRSKKVGEGVCSLVSPGRAPGHHVIFRASLLCANALAGKHVDASVEFLPSGLAVLRNGKTVYRAGWDPGTG